MKPSSPSFVLTSMKSPCWPSAVTTSPSSTQASFASHTSSSSLGSARQRSIVEPAASWRRTVQMTSGGNTVAVDLGGRDFCGETFCSAAGWDGAMKDLKMAGTVFQTKLPSKP